LAALQYKLWCEPDGIKDWWQLKQAIMAQNSENQQLQQRNTQLAAEIQDLKVGEDAIQEHARNDLGMIKQGEVFYQAVDK
jgi:cell division protein FtsB